MRFRKMIAGLAASAVLVSALSQHAAEARGVPGYDAAVKLVETYYKAKSRGIPWYARGAVGVAKVVSADARRVARYGNVKIAVFEDQEFTPGTAAEFGPALRQRLAPHWSRLLAVGGVEDGQVYTFVRRDGELFKVLTVVIEPRDAVVVQADLNLEEFAKLLANPEDESRALTRDATTADDK
ncbi:MAG TPA: hypothetical protein VK421_07645 [Pyrinomonadaceae bacterium]|nr:hypothetical protein [Pyrinomonadaceae bacterium]